MSCTFDVGDTVLWSPSNTVARLFHGQAQAVAAAFAVPCGLGPIIEDECEIDLPVFERFVAEITKQYDRATHPILRSLTVGFIGTASVLVERAGALLPGSEPDQAGAWARLRQEYSRSMPR
jgi:Family of unknown function (DUF6086)